MINKKTKYLIGISLVLITLVIILNNTYSNSFLEEHCNMLPGADGCEKYRGKYQETSEQFTRSLNNLKPVQKSTIYDAKSNEIIQLSIDPVKNNINGHEFRAYGYNGQIPGTILRTNQGETIFVNVTNNLEMDTTVHWHGVRLKNKFDGVPHLTQDPIHPGESFLYELTFPDAGIYWYHPHEREDYQQELGLYGNILVEPNDPTYYNEVNREEFLFLDDIQLNNGDITPIYQQKINQVLMGRFGNVMLVNGKENYNLSVKKGEVLRFYITNSANTRLFNFSIEDSKLKVIGTDGGNYQKEFFTNSVIISPSERAVIEVLFDKSGEYDILHVNPENKYVLGRINVLEDKIKNDYSKTFNLARKNDNITKELEAYKAWLNTEPDVNLKLDVSLPGMRMMGQHMQMNHADESGLEWEDVMQMMNFGSSNNTINWLITDTKTQNSNMDIKYKWKVGDKIKIRITNDEDSAHPMQHPIHLHGQRFLVLSTDGVPNDNLAWKDTVLVPTGRSIDILVDMTNPGKWMTHCHIAEHLSDGMMFEFEVEE